MIYRVLFLLFICSFLTDCKKEVEKTIIFQTLYFRDGIKMQTDTIPLSMKFSIESGKYTLKDIGGNIVCEGEYDAGFKIGQWRYHLTDTSEVKVIWSKYRNDSSGVEINYPSDWTALTVPTRPFQAAFPLNHGENRRGKYFIILNHNIDSLNMNLNSYQSYYKSQMFSGEKVKEYAHFLFETVSGKKFYFMRYILVRENEEFSIFTFVGDKGKSIYDITFSSGLIPNDRKHIIFFDMIRSLRLNGEYFFSPFDPVIRSERFEYKDPIKSIV